MSQTKIKIKIIAKNEAMLEGFFKGFNKTELSIKIYMVNIKGPNELIVSPNPPKRVKRATLVMMN